MLRYLEVGKDKIMVGDEIYIPDPGQVRAEGMEHAYGWQKIERGGRFDSIIGMVVMEIQLPLRRYERYWWEDVVRECEEILKLEGHAENPLSSNLPNAIREIRGINVTKKDDIVTRVKEVHYNLKKLAIDFIKTDMFISMKGQVRCWNCNDLLSTNHVSLISTNKGQYGLCRDCACEFEARGVPVVKTSLVVDGINLKRDEEE